MQTETDIDAFTSVKQANTKKHEISLLAFSFSFSQVFFKVPKGFQIKGMEIALKTFSRTPYHVTSSNYFPNEKMKETIVLWFLTAVWYIFNLSYN